MSEHARHGCTRPDFLQEDRPGLRSRSQSRETADRRINMQSLVASLSQEEVSFPDNYVPESRDIIEEGRASDNATLLRRGWTRLSRRTLQGLRGVLDHPHSHIIAGSVGFGLGAAVTYAASDHSTASTSERLQAAVSHGVSSGVSAYNSLTGSFSGVESGPSKSRPDSRADDFPTEDESLPADAYQVAELADAPVAHHLFDDPK